MILFRLKACASVQLIEFEFVSSTHIVSKNEGALSRVRSAISCSCVMTVPVIHCSQSFGLVVGDGDDWKFVFSGDTRPCEALVEAGRGADLVLHEATFDNMLLEDARDKKHSTVSEALSICDKIGATWAVLTHFSQRYPKVVEVTGEGVDGARDVVLAFDCMKLTADTICCVSAVASVVNEMFQEEEGKEESEKIKAT